MKSLAELAWATSIPAVSGIQTICAILADQTHKSQCLSCFAINFENVIRRQMRQSLRDPRHDVTVDRPSTLDAGRTISANDPRRQSSTTRVWGPLRDFFWGWGPLRGIEMWGDRATAPYQHIWIGGFLTCVAGRYKNMLRAGLVRRDAPMTWHVYRLIDPRTGKPFYVGCTTVPRDRFQVTSIIRQNGTIKVPRATQPWSAFQIEDRSRV